jgi:hypothetical protein
MSIGDHILVSGCFTQDKFIQGQTLSEIEHRLGFRSGRFAQGVAVVYFLELPTIDQFDVAGYTNVASHRFRVPEGLNMEKLKKEAMATWKTEGMNRLVKVIPVQHPEPTAGLDGNYPPGDGVPQWICKVKLRAEVASYLSRYPVERYAGAR